MSIALSAVGLTLASFVLHVLFWRTMPPKRHTRALLVIFVIVGAAGIAALHRAQHPGLPHTVQDLLYVALLSASLAMAYIITYSAVEAKSPTLVMIEMASAAGGIAEAQIYERLGDSVLIAPRLADLVRDGLAELKNGQYRITAKGRAFVSIFILHRSLQGLREKGG